MKKWICRVLVFLFIIGISIVISNAVAENGLTEGEFARYAINNRNDFFDDEWLSYINNYHLIPAGGAIYNVSAVCLFHTQSGTIGGDVYSTLKFIIDINGSTIKLNGNVINKDKMDVLKLAYALNHTYTGTEGVPDSTSKELTKNLFHTIFPTTSNELPGFARQGGDNKGNNDTQAYKDMNDEAEAYAKAYSDIIEPTKMTTTNQPSIYTDGRKSYLGPFKANFKGYPVESIELSVNGESSKIINKIYIKKDGEYEEKNTVPANEAFYILLDDTSVSNYRLKIKFKRSVYKARMMLFGNDWVTGQNIGVYATTLGLGDDEDEELELEWMDNLSGKLKIIKRDFDSNKKISGVKIKVTGPNNYEKEFTMSGSSKTLSGLAPGTYTIVETETPPGYKLDYQAKSVEINTEEEAEITAGNTTEVTMYNRKYTDLIIIKGINGTKQTVADITSQKMSDVIFKIYIEEDGVKKYIGNNCNIPTERDDNTVVDDLKLTTDINKAKEFKTNGGEVRLYNIPVNKYYIKEVKLPEDKSQYYNMSEEKSISTYTDSNDFEYYLKRVTKNLYENSTAKSVTKSWDKDKLVQSLYRSITGSDLNNNTIENRLKTLLGDKGEDDNYTDDGINEVVDEIFEKHLTEERINNIKTDLNTKKAYIDYILGSEQLDINLRVLIYDLYLYRLNKYSAIVIDNDMKTGNLQITKSDYDTKQALQGAQFNITNNLDPSDVRYVNKNVTTGPSGKIELKNLPIGEYTITETKAPDGYKLSLQNVQKIVKVEENRTVTVSYTNRKYGDLMVEKIDQDKNQDSDWSGDELHKLEELIFKDAKFKIYYTTENDSTPRYITNFVNDTENPSVFGDTTNENDSNVTIFTTDENAKFELNNIPQYYNYHIKEIELSDEMAKYYDIKSDTLDVKLENNNNETKTEVQFENKQLRIDIEGYVWEDKASSKETVRDDVYDISATDAKDKLISDIPVYLYKNGVHIATRYTDDDGKYFFPAKSKFNSDTDGTDYTIDLFYYENNQIIGVTGAGLQQYHIEFEYNGLKYQSVISAWNMDEERRNATWEINSKADEKQELRDGINNNFNTILENGPRNGSEGQTNGKTSTGVDLTYDTEKITEGDVTYYESYLVNNTRHTSNSLNGYVEPINVATMFAETPSASKDVNSNQNNGSPLKWKSGLRTIKNINLGMYERMQPDLSIATDIDNIEFNINGYAHTYNYKNRIDGVLPDLPELSEVTNENYEAIMNDFSIKAKNKYTGSYKSLTYTRYIYDSYIAYTDKSKNNDNKLKIFVTYKISVINEGGNKLISKVGLRNFADDNLKFNNSYYIYKYKENGIVKEERGRDNIIWKKDIGNNYWETYGMIDYNISPGYSMDVYLTYELDTKKIISLMKEKDMTLDSNVTEIKEYQTLDEEGKLYGGIDRDSAPGNIIYENTDTYEDDTDSAPDIKFSRKESKQLSGLVFEDNPENITKEELNTNNERKGNGQYDDGENKIKNVKVELIKYSESGEDLQNIGKLYAIDEKGEAIENDASGVTDENGEYHFSGLIPGQYYIKYTYGDYNDEGSHTVIIDASGKEVNKVTTQNYKSTIVNTELYKQLIDNNIENENGRAEIQADFENKKSEQALWYWYQNRRNNDNGNQSSAVDNKSIRSNINKTLSKINYNSKTNYEEQKLEELHKMEAYTGMMDMSIEDYQGQSTQFNYDDKSDRNYKVKFGIIERPRQSLQVNKEISNISLTLANGQVLAQGDPRSENVNYITYPEFGPAKIEVDSEIIEGSTLDLTYEIRIDNRSEKDYDSVDYYRYGDYNNIEVVKIKLDTIVDYLDEKLSVTYDIDKADSEFEYYNNDTFDIVANTDSKWKLITESLTSDNKIVQNIDSNVYNSIKKRSNIIVKNLGQEIEPDKYVKLNLTAKKLLANLNNTDQIFDNYTELIHVSNSVGRFYGEVVTNEGWKLATPGNFNITKIQDENANDECDNSYYDRFAKYTRGNEWGEVPVPVPPPTPTPPPSVRDAQLVIIPPTGGNNIALYCIIGLGCLIILSGGIVLIKKIVLD